MRGLARQAEPLKTRTTIEIKEEMRREYGVPLPSWHNLFGPICRDFNAKYGRGGGPKDLSITEQLIAFWRRNRDKYDFPLTSEGHAQEEAQRKANFREMVRRAHMEFDPLIVYGPGTVEEALQMDEAMARGIDLKAVRAEAKDAQLEAMRALVGDLPGDRNFGKGGEHMGKAGGIDGNTVDKVSRVDKGKGVHHGMTVDKGKAVVYISSDDDSDDDEVIPGCEDD